MTQTNHSELMNDMDRATNDLVRLMTTVGRMSLDRTTLQENVATLTHDNFRLQCDISTMRQCAKDDKEMYEQIINEKNLALAEEEKYADNLHDALSDMKLTLLQMTDNLAREKERQEALQEEKRKESEQLRYDLENMYRLRDEIKAERDSFEKEAMDRLYENQLGLLERKRLIEERDLAKENYKAACMELREEYEAHSKTIAEHNQLLSTIGLSAEKLNRRQSCVETPCSDNADSIS